MSGLPSFQQTWEIVAQSSPSEVIRAFGWANLPQNPTPAPGWTLTYIKDQPDYTILCSFLSERVVPIPEQYREIYEWGYVILTHIIGDFMQKVALKFDSPEMKYAANLIAGIIELGLIERDETLMPFGTHILFEDNWNRFKVLPATRKNIESLRFHRVPGGADPSHLVYIKDFNELNNLI